MCEYFRSMPPGIFTKVRISEGRVQIKLKLISMFQNFKLHFHFSSIFSIEIDDFVQKFEPE